MTTALTAGADGDLSSGSYYLSGNVAYRGVAPLTVSGDVTLCLNGYELNLNGQCIYVGSGADLTLCDCGDGNSGVITGGLGYEDGFDTSGGGVYVENGGNFTMEGGTITGNKTSLYGGGVDVYEYNGSYVNPQTVRSGSTVAEPDAPSRAGYCFTGWYLDGWR